MENTDDPGAVSLIERQAHIGDIWRPEGHNELGDSSVEVDIDPRSPYPVQIVKSPVSSLDPRETSPRAIKVRAISIKDLISCQVKLVEPSLQIKVDPNAPPLVVIEEEPMP
eukprot:jgi/Psemu1/33144/gm1.33144_g